jgi:hypothetical protein
MPCHPDRVRQHYSPWANRQDEVRQRLARWRELKAEEKRTGRASYELLELEDTLGSYVDVLAACLHA